ncbi:MAG: PKD domain-containing protein [Planctomycetes bacterium]|nr:PKD domain-containing protein [Planctomycetota bacterium]MCB9885295.1 PKD domain-containing protein [Planctomycetota bacterium]
MPHSLLHLGCVLTTASACLAQFAATFPDAAYATAEGNSNFVLPWSAGANGGRVQFCHDSSLFTGPGMSGPIRITGLRYRPDAIANSSNGGTYPSVVIDMSTCLFDYLSITNTFANNHGPDLTNVFNGPVTVSPFTGGSAPQANYVDIALTTPFVYDPTLGGDLLIEFVVNAGWTGAAPGAVDHVGPGATPAALSSRVWISGTGAPTSPTGNANFSPTFNYSPVFELVYEPATGLWPNFVATTSTTGATPLAVQFADRSVTDDPNGIVLYQWDFDGDSVVDSTLQNPTFNYASCGSYDVTLTVLDGLHGLVSTTKTSFVVTDQVAADFTYVIQPGNLVSFTDASTPTPTAWAWDFDGDSVVDSTLQNPVWPAPAACAAYQVTLTASRACGPAASKTVGISLAPNSLTTQLTAGSGFFGSGSGNLFDVTVLNPAGITVCALTNCPYTDGTVPLGAPLQCQVYVTDLGCCTTSPTTHSNAAAWRLAATGTGAYAGGNSGSPVPITMTLDRPIYLAQGNYGVAVHMIGAGIAYRIGAVNTGNADLTVVAGGAKSGVFNTTLTASRSWSGTLHYDTLGGAATAGYGFFGAGCPGSMGISSLTPNAAPSIGTTMTVTIDALPLSAAFVLFGFSNTVSLFGPLPLDATSFGAPGCFGRVSSEAAVFLVGGGNTVAWSLTIPADPAYLGQLFYQQALPLDPGLNGLGASFSDAMAMMIGN